MDIIQTLIQSLDPAIKSSNIIIAQKLAENANDYLRILIHFYLSPSEGSLSSSHKSDNTLSKFTQSEK